MQAAEISRSQAAGLHRMMRRRPVRVIAVTSGKGGVGKTNVSVNLSIALAQRGNRVLLLDGDLGLGNADVLLGLHPRHNLSHVLDGECSIEDVIVEGPAGIRLIPAASGLRRMAMLGEAGHASVIRAFSEIPGEVDVMVVDTAAGAGDSVMNLVRACQEIVLVVCDEPASITDAYALMKLLNREGARHRFRILANMVRSFEEARELYVKLVRASDRFLSVSLDFMGSVPYDDMVRKSVQRQRAVVDAFPGSRASLAFKKLALVTDNWPVPEIASGQLEFFVERLVENGRRPVEATI